MEQRTCEIFTNGEWQTIDFSLVHTGDKFRLYEPTGEIVEDDDGNTEFTATSDSYFKEGLWTININN